MPIYNKLVRDRIPEIIEQDGNKTVTRILSEDEYLLEIKHKMHEELIEYEEAAEDADQLEELADLLELVHAAAAVLGATPAELEELRAEKAAQRGGFSDRIYLVEVHDE